ncbi:MAG: glycosyltransferase, partial [Halioglobus sp.]
LPTVLDALGSLPVTAVVATAGASLPGNVPANTFVADYLPGALACEMADLVVCNGGSPTAHQALAQGVPVLGLAGNLDQFLSMGAVEQAGAGRRLRAGSAGVRSIARAVEAMLQDEDGRGAAEQVAKWFSETACEQIFYRTIKEMDVS